MNYAAILAGGIGARMKRSDLPKQFLMLGEKPIIIHTLEQFFIADQIDAIIVALPKEWINYTKDIIDKYMQSSEGIYLTAGGSNRNETIACVCRYIRENFAPSSSDIVVTHDAVRPFITQRLIEDNIAALGDAAVADTVIPSSDTIVESADGQYVDKIPQRNHMYQGQTPQTFHVDDFLTTYGALSDEEKRILTDAAKIFILRGKKVKLVRGELYNIKITTPYDLQIATYIVEARGSGAL